DFLLDSTGGKPVNKENNSLIENRQALIDAAVELEKQEFIRDLALCHCMDQLEAIRKQLDSLTEDSKVHPAKCALFDCILSAEEQTRIFPDEQLDEWETEFHQTITATNL